MTPQSGSRIDPPPAAPARLAAQREKILALLADAPDVAFIRHRGNIGDDLIHAGTRRPMADIPCREFGTWDLQHARDHTAVITGSGGWCVPFHHQLPQALPLIEQRFRRVVILPSTFDLKEPIVRDALARTKALVFARERASYEQIRGVCDADIGHDCAFFFDFAPYRRRGSGHLLAYRTDAESARSTVPQILIVIAARFGRVSWKYSALAYSLSLKDVGVLTQTLYLMATNMGLGGCAIGSVNIDLFARMTGIEFHVEGPVGQFALGRGTDDGGRTTADG